LLAEGGRHLGAHPGSSGSIGGELARPRSTVGAEGTRLRPNGLHLFGDDSGGRRGLRTSRRTKPWPFEGHAERSGSEWTRVATRVRDGRLEGRPARDGKSRDGSVRVGSREEVIGRRGSSSERARRSTTERWSGAWARELCSRVVSRCRSLQAASGRSRGSRFGGERSGGLAKALRCRSEGTPNNRKSPAVRRTCSEGDPGSLRTEGAGGGRHRGSWRAMSGSRPRRRKRARPSRSQRPMPGPEGRGGDGGVGGTATGCWQRSNEAGACFDRPSPGRVAVKRISTGNAPRGFGLTEDGTGGARDAGVRLENGRGGSQKSARRASRPSRSSSSRAGLVQSDSMEACLHAEVVRLVRANGVRHLGDLPRASARGTERPAPLTRNGTGYDGRRSGARCGRRPNPMSAGNAPGLWESHESSWEHRGDGVHQKCSGSDEE